MVLGISTRIQRSGWMAHRRCQGPLLLGECKQGIRARHSERLWPGRLWTRRSGKRMSGERMAAGSTPYGPTSTCGHRLDLGAKWREGSAAGMLVQRPQHYKQDSQEPSRRSSRAKQAQVNTNPHLRQTLGPDSRNAGCSTAPGTRCTHNQHAGRILCQGRKLHLGSEGAEHAHALPVDGAIRGCAAVQPRHEVQGRHVLQAVVDVEHAVRCRHHVAAAKQRAGALQAPASRTARQPGAARMQGQWDGVTAGTQEAGPLSASSELQVALTRHQAKP